MVEVQAPSVGSEPTNARRLVNILGVDVDASNLTEAVVRVEQWIAERRRSFIIFRDVHGLMRCQNDVSFRAAHAASHFVATDGMPLVWMARRAHGPTIGRVYGPDFMKLFLEITGGKYRHYFFGSTPETIEKLVASIRLNVPDLVVAGIYSPPFRPLSDAEDAEIVRTINEARPDVVWVGLGTPKQELWMHAHRGRLEAPALMGVGAAFDFLAGTKPQAPRWVRQNGLEWVFRLATEPRRLTGRYFTYLPAFVVAILGEVLRKRLKK
jgi:N-acetylglucosaminyldiphosphoundecaprenol N-acetyl-beta-D-mannosaminyltransferase